MRSSKIEIEKTTEGKPCGIVWNGAYCAEHECGITELAGILGIKDHLTFHGTTKPKEDFGVEPRIFSRTNGVDFLFWEEKQTPKGKKAAGLYLGAINETLPKAIKGWNARFGKLDKFDKDTKYGLSNSGAWGKEACLVRSCDPETIAVIEYLAKAIEQGEAAIWVFRPSKNPFEKDKLLLICTKDISEKDRREFTENELLQTPTSKS